MTEKTEWEIVDDHRPNQRRTLRRTLEALLGPAWRWKVAGAVVLATMALLVVAAVAGTVMVLIAAFTLVSLAVGKLRSWLRRDDASAALQKWQ